MSRDKFRLVMVILAAIVIVSGLHYGRYDVERVSTTVAVYKFDRLTGEVCWLAPSKLPRCAK